MSNGISRFFENDGSAEKSNTKKGMHSLRELYKIGRGPSSSHTIGPERACKRLKELYPDAEKFKVFLYGSLALTGQGHRTDVVIEQTLAPVETEIVFDVEKTDLPHPNTMDVEVYKNGEKIKTERIISVGGGTVLFNGESAIEQPIIYPHTTYAEIAEYCSSRRMRIWQYVLEMEDEGIFDYLSEIWRTMRNTVYEGLAADGIIPGRLNLQRKAKYLYNQKHMDESPATRENRIVCSYAFAASEQNAYAATVVTAPTCGASGVLPAVLLYEQEKFGLSDEAIVKALATAGIIGNLIKTNASISGAECGCQAEIGSACSMAAAALAEIFEMGINQVEYSAEIAMEHHLGLTCDPIFGLVQIPCIERNAVAAMRAINAVSLANFLSDSRKNSFDLVVRKMYETGLALASHYKETSEGALAKLYR